MYPDRHVLCNIREMKSASRMPAKEVMTMMGGWLIWLLLGGLFLFLMFRGGGCCGGHGSHGGRSGHSESDGNDRHEGHGHQ